MPECFRGLDVDDELELRRLLDGDSDPADPRNSLREQFQTLADELRGKGGQPRDIAARSPKLVTSPSVTGSAAPANTMGRVLVDCLVARA